MKKRNKRGWALVLAAALFMGILVPGGTPAGRDTSVSAAETTASADKNYGLENPVVEAVSPTANTSHELSNPRNDNGTVTWDCVYFGNYWQNDTNGDGVADKRDEKEPIKWRVLSVDGDDAFLLADQNLDVQKYNDTDTDVTWETCTMRSWLNGYGADENVCGTDYSENNFLDNAFTESEQEAIKVTDVVNEDNPEDDGTEGGNYAQDKVYLLSISEVMNLEYGFPSAEGDTNIRKVVNTAYVAAVDGGSTDYWWLRSSGNNGKHASNVGRHGHVNKSGHYVDFNRYAVRPALHLNLSSASKWKKAGTVSSDGGEITAAWDCIWFGNYPQSDAAGIVKESIKWHVLSVDGDDAFLLADQNLDVQRYNDTNEDVTWETCTMRTWLNNAFLNKAFTTSEQAAIKVTDVVNGDNDLYHTEGGNNTQDKVYLLSLSEVMNQEYGFLSTGDSTHTRKAVNTAYVTAGGETNAYFVTDHWWLRSPGRNSDYTPIVDGDGYVDEYGHYVDYNYYAVRPALHLDLSSAEWTYAGTVSSTGEKNEIPAPNPAPSATPTPTPKSTPQTTNPQVTAPATTVLPVTPHPTPGSGTGTTPPASATQTTKPQDTSSVGPAPGSGAGTTATAAPTASPKQSVQPQDTASSKAKIGKVSGLKVTAKKKAVQASWKKVSGADGYEVQVSTSKKFTKNSVKTTKKTKLTISKLKAKKKYFVRVRAYRVTRGKKTYGKWSKTASGKTKV